MPNSCKNKLYFHCNQVLHYWLKNENNKQSWVIWLTAKIWGQNFACSLQRGCKAEHFIALWCKSKSNIVPKYVSRVYCDGNIYTHTRDGGGKNFKFCTICPPKKNTLKKNENSSRFANFCFSENAFLMVLDFFFFFGLPIIVRC